MPVYRVRFDVGHGEAEWPVKARSPAHAAHLIQRGIGFPRALGVGERVEVFDQKLKRWIEFELKIGGPPMRIE